MYKIQFIELHIKQKNRIHCIWIAIAARHNLAMFSKILIISEDNLNDNVIIAADSFYSIG